MDETHRDVRAIDITIEIEEMNFQQGFRPTYRWPDAEIGDTGKRLVAQPTDLDGKNARHRQWIVLDTQIGCRETDLAAELLAMRHLAVDNVGTAQQAGCMLHVTGQQRPANRRTGHAFTISCHAAHCLDSEAESPPGVLKKAKVASAAATKAKIIADDQMSNQATTHQHLLNELISRKGGKSCVKRTDHRLTRAALAQQLQLFTQGRQTGRRRVRRKKLARVGFEGQHHGRQIKRFSHLSQAFDQRRMPKVNAIEIANGKHNRSGNGTRMTAENAHKQISRKNVEL